MEKRTIIGRRRRGTGSDITRCPGCGELVDKRDLNQVLAHASHGLIKRAGVKHSSGRRRPRRL